MMNTYSAVDRATLPNMTRHCIGYVFMVTGFEEKMRWHASVRLYAKKLKKLRVRFADGLVFEVVAVTLEDILVSLLKIVLE
jgi:hypothetical protein